MTKPQLKLRHGWVITSNFPEKYGCHNHACHNSCWLKEPQAAFIFIMFQCTNVNSDLLSNQTSLYEGPGTLILMLWLNVLVDLFGAEFTSQNLIFSLFHNLMILLTFFVLNLFQKSLIFSLFHNTGLVLVVETFPQKERQQMFHCTESIPWVSMSWCHKESGHQQSWYCQVLQEYVFFQDQKD